MNAESKHEMFAESAHDEPPIDVSRSPRLQEILNASHESYREYGGISADEVRKKLREWEAEEQAADRLKQAPQTQ